LSFKKQGKQKVAISDKQCKFLTKKNYDAQKLNLAPKCFDYEFFSPNFAFFDIF